MTPFARKQRVTIISGIAGFPDDHRPPPAMALYLYHDYGNVPRRLSGDCLARGVGKSRLFRPQRWPVLLSPGSREVKMDELPVSGG